MTQTKKHKYKRLKERPSGNFTPHVMSLGFNFTPLGRDERFDNPLAFDILQLRTRGVVLR